MNLAATIFCTAATLLSVQAITVSVDRADVRPLHVPTQPSHDNYGNGWRPVTSGYDDIGVNVSPSGALDRSLAPLHPVLGKLQEHMAVSERLKPINRNKIPQLEYSPSNLLGTLAFFNQALGGQHDERVPVSELKSLSTEREYSFLIPPPRDTLRFELEPHKKSPFREEDPYVRSSQFIPQAIKPDSRSPTYFIKPATFTTNPYNPGRPFINNYNVQQSLIPPRQPPKQFDPLKTTNEKPYFQPSNVDVTGGFNKDNSKVNAEQSYERFQPQRVVNGQYYNQINHPQSYKQASFLPEREQSFLVHESHEVAPAFGTATTPYKFRPFHYEPQEAFPSSTPASRLEQNKFIHQQQHQQHQHQQQQQQQQQHHHQQQQQQQQQHHHQQQQRQQGNNIRPDGFKQFSQSTKEPEKNDFFITDFQKTRYQTPDINEVLPKTNSPAKFNQVSTTPAPSYVPDHSPKVVYVRPEIQQQQYQSSIIPLNINQRPPEVEYDTPESISLKHFNEQQFLLQQQLIQQDRQRLREQEKRRQQELQRQQQEEINKRQQEIKLLEQKHKEKQRLEQYQTPEPDIVKEIPQRPSIIKEIPQRPEIVKEIPQRPVQQVHQFLQPASYPAVEQKPVLQEPYRHVYHQVSTESPQHVVTVQKFEEVVTPGGTPATTQEEFQPVVRPYRPQKPSREQIRRRKPTTVIYNTAPTEPPTPAYTELPEEPLTEVPIQTTSAPETTTVTVTERIIRTRRPGAPLRRRRPSTTTTTQEPNTSSQDFEEDVVKYNSPEVQDFEKKKRVRPASYNQGSAERRPLYRKRPGQRVKSYNKERNEYESVPERVRTTEQTLKDISDTENYPAPFLKEYYSSEYIPTSEKALTADTPQEVSTEGLPIQYYYETTLAPISIYQEPTQAYRQEQYAPESETNGALDHYFTKTEVNYVETTTTPPTTTTTPSTTTTTTTEASTTTRPTVISTVKPTHRMRPVRYGNATRPRFSIKDYKSRVDYKSRLSQSSSTEASTVTASPKVRGHKNQQNPADPNFKEAAIRYKYMSRTPYRSTTTTTSLSSTVEETSPTTERSTSSRFTPKKRINTNHYYRSRLSTSTPSSRRDQEHPSVIHSTSRPENVFSSAIRKRPTLKSKLSLAERNRVSGDASEMQSAAETGSFATTTLVATVSEAAANEVDEPTREVAVEEAATKRPAEATPTPLDLSDVSMEENEERERPEAATERTAAPTEPTTEGQTTAAASPLDSTTPFDLRHEEELFAKASQSVADLTSSASALYDKPGMFKAVSPAAENRAISAHLKITTDEPTLPIEAFFHEISRKN